ncbi:hypothetical protein [Klebsiella quasipneumoniae]|uniref:hypothetical protein n=1 Tax=Klebsiella quasipneumoniae TaxID=1463165 RepID=UPI00277F3E10|nr:hypothetical protein [Klebsiella quasipneumoniae]MDX7656936.1 hypothetical protein [Klebsiella quasipneumoniae]HDT0537837.1 hypothetical protein [Klebsiella quasipneumoniae subsp. similipneumoniae]
MTDPNNKNNIDIELLKVKVDIWKQVINTQQHFNDLAMKIRNFAILILSAFIGAIGVSFKSGFAFNMLGHSTSIATILSFGAALIWLLFFFVDVYWYHPLLIGAVKKGIHIEKHIGTELKDYIDLTHTIGKESPKEIKFSIFKKVLARFELHSNHKAKTFYIGVFILLITSSIILFFVDKPELPVKGIYDKPSLSIHCKRTINYDGINCNIIPQ